MYISVVGLEIHLQVKTNSKMFCRCSTGYFGKEPNLNICPVCFGLPGALPVPNKQAFEKCVKLALALNCSLNKETKFDRKNYFYPDLPKGYQISQYDQPIGYDGYAEMEVEGDSRRIRIQRVHLEEDTAKSLHDENDETLIDYNKSGIALIEIVTHPDFENVEEVIAFAKRLRQIVRYLDTSDAEMQKGQMRFELNISIRNDEEKELPQNITDLEKSLGFKLPSYKVEVKNIGSISVLEKVMNFETERQSKLLEKGEKIPNQTRGLKGMTGETVFQRSKETADDYRYFPEPDIPPIHISNELINELKSQIPELPVERKQRYINLGLEGEQANILVEDTEKGKWFDEFINNVNNNIEVKERNWFIKEGIKWLIGEISAQVEKRKLFIWRSVIGSFSLLEILIKFKDKAISGTIAKEIINEIFERGLGVQENIVSDIIISKNLIQISDLSEVESFARQAVESNPKVVADILKNPNAIKFLVGQVMKLSKGKINPKIAEQELEKVLKK